MIKFIFIFLFLPIFNFCHAQSVPLPAGYHSGTPFVKTQKVEVNGQTYTRTVTVLPIINELNNARTDFIQMGLNNQQGQSIASQAFVAPVLPVGQNATMTIVKTTESANISPEVVRALAHHTDVAVSNWPMDAVNVLRLSYGHREKVDSTLLQHQIAQTLSNTSSWAQSRSAVLAGELKTRDNNAKYYMASSHDSAVSINEQSRSENKAMAVELTGLLFAASSLDLKNFEAAQISEAFASPLNDVAESAVYPQADFIGQTVEVDRLLQRHEIMQAAFILNNLSDPGTKVLGKISKAELIKKYIDHDGLAKLGGQQNMFQKPFSTKSVILKSRLSQTANLFQAASIQQRYSLSSEPQKNGLFRVGAMHLRLADQYFDRGLMTEGQASLYMAKTIALYVGGIITGSSLGVLNLGAGALVLIKNICGTAEIALDDKNFVKNLVDRSVDQVLNFIKPNLSEIARTKALEITKEPSFQTGAVTGRIIFDTAVAWATGIKPVFLVGAVAQSAVKNIDQFKSDSPVLRSLALNEIDVALGSETKIGQWFRQRIETDRMKSQIYGGH
jgi:hypothetical protein